MKNGKIYNCDFLELSLDTKVNLIYCDPPYGPESEDRFYGVGKDLPEFLAWLNSHFEKIATCVDFQKGNVVIHMDYKCSHYAKLKCDELFGRNNFKGEIVWCYTGPSKAKRYPPRKHDVLMWWGLGDYVYNPVFVPYDSRLVVGAQSGWNPNESPERYLARGKHLEDWWTDIPALCRNENEKVGYKTQKPLRLLTRVVEMLSNPGDKILDPMMGSGTTLVVAKKLGRIPFGCDVNKQAFDITKQRLEK